MASRLSIEERIQIVFLFAKFKNFPEVRSKNHFTTPPPNEKTIRYLVDKFKEAGSVHDRERPGRSRSIVTEEAVQNV